MADYNYYEAVMDDVFNYIKENDFTPWDEENEIDYGDRLYNECLNEDSVTGNASGSYTFNTYEAEENLAHNWELMRDVANEFGVDLTTESPEGIDVAIRCYLLGNCCADVARSVFEDREGE